MRNLLKKCITVMLSITLIFGTMINQPVRAEEELVEVSEEELYITGEEELVEVSEEGVCAEGLCPTDMSKISDDMKINTLEEYYDILANEQQINRLTNVDEVVTQEELPDAVDLSTSEYFPAIGNQYSLGACTSFAQTYYQFTYEMNRKMGRATTKENTFSPIYPYNFVANNNGIDGAMPSEIYDLLKYKGTIPWSNTNYSYNAKTWFPDKEIWKEADNYRIKDYQFLSVGLGESGYEISSPDDSDLDVIKTALSNGEMICASTFISSWNDDDDNATIAENSPHAGEKITIDVTGYEGCHRMTIVGYDDNIWVDINGDHIAQDAEKGAFKIVNSWGEGAGDDGFYWFAYDAINLNSQAVSGTGVTCGLYDFARISVADYDSDSDIKLVYTLNTNSRKELRISVQATDREMGTVYTKEATPYYLTDGNSDTRNLSFNGTENVGKGTMTMDLDTVVPDFTTEAFDNYVWEVTFEELIDNNYYTIIENVEIVDYNTEMVYELNESFGQTINGNEMEFVYNSTALGYDLEVTDISYTNLETGEKNGRIEPGDRIRFESTIKNVGDMTITGNKKLSALFSTNGKAVWNSGVQYENMLGLGSSVSVSAVSGENEGVVTFTQTGIYDVTVWANYNNALSNEYGGNAADNNKKTITIEVLPEEGGIKVLSFTASNEEPERGDTVTFTLSLKYDNIVQTKIDICNPKGMYLYRSEYVDGTQLSYQFDTVATYYVTATVKDVSTGEEVAVSQYVRITVNEKKTGYDLELNSLGYNDVDTDIYNGKVYVGDRIQLEAKIKNVGEVNAPDNQTMRVSFQIDDDEDNKLLNEYTEITGLAAGESTRLVSSSGGQNGDGTYTFTEVGTYTITAWVNDTNEMSEELGGYMASNNKMTITIEVYAKDSINSIENFQTDKTSVIQGENVNFSVSSYDVIAAAKIRLDVYTESYELYDSIGYEYGLDQDYCFEEVGTYYVQAIIAEMYNGEKGITSKIPITVGAADGYDLSVGTIGYQNVETNENNAEVVVGDTLKFNTIIKNAGTQTVDENGYLIVNFRIQGEDTDVTVRYDNNTTITYLQAGQTDVFESNRGGENDDGIYTFSKAGTYTLTVSVNDDNTFSNEICGNTARNNTNSITINVVEPSSITINDFTADKVTIIAGEKVEFTIECSYENYPSNRYEIYNEDGTLYEEYDKLHSMSREIIFKETGTYDVRAVVEDIITGEIKTTEKIRITVLQPDGYDLSVIGLTYVNVDTGQVGGGLKAGDRIRLQARIKNIGNINAPDNTLMQVTYSINDGERAILYNDQFVNRTGLAAGGSSRLNSNKGGVNGDGIYTIIENGTYTFTASVNDDNAFPDEACGNMAKNNQKTITVTVAEPEKRIQVNYFEASADEVFAGEVVEFYAGVSNVSTAMMKLCIYGMNGVSYNGSYTMGTQASYQFEQEGTYYVQATILDPVTSEEVITRLITVNVKNNEN